MVPQSRPEEDTFEYGAGYVARQTFDAFRGHFEAREILLYWNHAVSVYDGMQGWFFLRADGERPMCRSWDIELGGDVSQAETLFEKTAPPHPLVTAATAGDLDGVERACALPRVPFDGAISRLAVESAITKGHVDITVLLAGRLDDEWVRSNQPLRHAVLRSRAAVAARLVSFGMDPECTQASRQTAMDIAKIRKDEEMLAALGYTAPR